MANLLRNQLGQFLRRKRGERTLRQFAGKVGLSIATLRRIEIGRQNVTLDTLEQVLRSLRVGVRDVFRD